MRQVAEDYMKASGNKLDYSIMPFMAMNQKTISALTSGDVPDLVFMDAPSSILPQNAWDDKTGRRVATSSRRTNRSFRKPRSSARPSTTR